MADPAPPPAGVHLPARLLGPLQHAVHGAWLLGCVVPATGDPHAPHYAVEGCVPWPDGVAPAEPPALAVAALPYGVSIIGVVLPVSTEPTSLESSLPKELRSTPPPGGPLVAVPHPGAVPVFSRVAAGPPSSIVPVPGDAVRVVDAPVSRALVEATLSMTVAAVLRNHGNREEELRGACHSRLQELRARKERLVALVTDRLSGRAAPVPLMGPRSIALRTLGAEPSNVADGVRFHAEFMEAVGAGGGKGQAEPPRLTISLMEDSVAITVEVRLSVLGIIPTASEGSLSDLCSVLWDKLLLQFSDIVPRVSPDATQFESFHFVVPTLAVPVAAVYAVPAGPQGPGPAAPADAANATHRAALHAALGLPPARPLLRVAQAWAPAGRPAAPPARPTILLNVHEHVPLPAVKGAEVALVQGTYDFYHYLLDGFNDKGWGCAYRSLQTLLSWFIHQGYASALATPPAIPELQRIIAAADPTKAKTFVGSKHWIGSAEITYALNHLLGVECQQEHVATAADLESRGRLLLHHFRTHGTPVMVGGGAYAYTILGAQYHPGTGQLSLLILDPHYVGPDDPAAVVAGQGCGWRSPKRFLRGDCFYNLCLPRVPHAV